MKYLNTAKKTIALPSGATIEIRKLNTFDTVFEAEGEDDTKRGRTLTRFILLEKVGPIEFDGECLQITEKAQNKGQISFNEIPMDDVNAITSAVLEFSGLSKAGQEARKTFLEEQGTNGSAAPSGEGIRVLADNTTQAAVG